MYTFPLKQKDLSLSSVSLRISRLVSNVHLSKRREGEKREVGREDKRKEEEEESGEKRREEEEGGKGKMGVVLDSMASLDLSGAQ